jgi:CBS domain-containing membrane protein
MNVEDQDGPPPTAGEIVTNYFINVYRKIFALENSKLHPLDPFRKKSPRYPWPEPIITYFMCFIGCFSSIGILGYLSYISPDSTYLIGSFGASCVLYFAAPNSSLAQPKNAFFGQLIGGIVGISFRNIFTEPETRWVGVAFAVATTTTLMMVFNVIHPPSGATALIAASLTHLPPGRGFLFVVVPVIVGNLLMMVLSLLLNNLNPYRHYPDYWN